MTAVTNNIAARLGSLGTTPPGFADPSDRESYAIDGLVPAAVAKPVSGEEAAEVVRFAAREKLAVVPVGARTKLSIGATPIRYDIALDMSAVNQISQYDPEDLTVSVCAGISWVLPSEDAASGRSLHAKHLSMTSRGYSRASHALGEGSRPLPKPEN